jgi:hypothetical protein
MLSIITIDNSIKWDEIVRSFNNYGVYYLNGYVHSFKTHGDGIPLLFYYEDDAIKAMNVVMKRDIADDERFLNKIPHGQYYDLLTPYGYGGFLPEGDNIAKSLKILDYEYSNYCHNYGIISEFVRFHPILQNSSKMNGMYNVTTLGKTISIDLDLNEQIWSDFSSENRNKIRKSQKNDVKIYWGQSQELYNQFIPLYNATMDKDNASAYYYFKNDFFDSILRDLKYNSMIFYAVYQDKIIAMSIMLFANNQMHYHLSASDREYQHLAPTNLLLYQAACWGCSNGFKTLHLGSGLGYKEDNLYKFKSAFNKNSNYTFEMGSKIFDKEKYDELVDMRRKDTGSDYNGPYFPLYRAI